MKARIHPEGIYRDRLARPGKAPEDRGWRSNIVVDRCRILLSGFMLGAAVQGIRFLAVGRGDAAWDEAEPGHPEANTVALTDPSPVFLPVAASDLAFLDDAGLVSVDPTPRLQVTLTLGPGTPPLGIGESAYPLREFGLIGTFGPDRYLIDYVRHPVINKGPADTLVRTIRLLF